MPEYITQTKLIISNGYTEQVMRVAVSSARPMSISDMAFCEAKINYSDVAKKLKSRGFTLIGVISNPLTFPETTASPTEEPKPDGTREYQGKNGTES